MEGYGPGSDLSQAAHPQMSHEVDCTCTIYQVNVDQFAVAMAYQLPKHIRHRISTLVSKV